MDAFGGKRPRWGYAGSPLVLDEKVIVDTGSPRASTVALHKDTGRPIWTSGNQMGAYAAPVVMTIDGRQTVLCFKATELVGIDPSNGRQLWAFEWKTSYDVHATPPMVFDGDKIFLSTGYNRGCTLLRIDRGRPVVLWENRDLSTQVNPAVVYEGHVYGITGNAGRGDLVCMRLSDGEVMWEQGGFGTGALMIADGYLVVTSERGGKLAVAPASPKGFNATGEMTGLYDGRSWVAPVLSHRKIFAKDNAGSLACVDVSE